MRVSAVKPQTPNFGAVNIFLEINFLSVAYRGGGGKLGVSYPHPKFRRPSKIMPNSNLIVETKIAEFRTPTPQDVRKKRSEILKLPSVRNCFTLALTDKLVAIINGRKVPKIKKLLLYEMKFLVPNYSSFQNTLNEGITMCLEIKYYNISVRQHNLIIYL